MPTTTQDGPQTEDRFRAETCARIIFRDHPLIALYRQRTGVQDVAIRSLKQFVIGLPQEDFNACMFGAGVRS